MADLREMALPRNYRQAPAPAVEEAPLTPEELRIASQPALPIYDAAGKMRGFVNRDTGEAIPRPAAAVPQPAARSAVPFNRGDESVFTGPQSAVPTKASPAAAPTAATPPAQAQELPFVTPAASNYESPHAANKRYLEIVADMATAVGHREAPKFRAAAVESHLTEAADRAEAAQKAFIKGDIDGAIAGFNAAAGGDNPILGYRKEKDGYTLKTAQGSQFRTNEQIQNALAALKNPQLIGQIALKQAEKQADLYNKVTEAKVKHQMSMEEAVLKGVLSRDQAMELAQFNKTHGGNKTHVSMTGEVFIDKADGTTVKVEQRPGRLDPKIKEWVEIPVSAGPSAGRGAQPASQGTVVDAARIAAALGGAR